MNSGQINFFAEEGEIMNTYKYYRNRPKDEIFENLDDLTKRANYLAENSREIPVNFTEVNVKEGHLGSDHLSLCNRNNAEYSFNNWSFQQYCNRKKAPYAYLARLGSNIAATCLNSERNNGTGKIYYFDDGINKQLRALTSSRYSRIYDKDILNDIIDPISTFDPTELVMSDRDMMLFLTDIDHPIEVDGDKSSMYRGVIVANSEVGAGTLRFNKFLYRSRCTNHCIFGVDDLYSINKKHIGAGVYDSVHRIMNSLQDFRNEDPYKLKNDIIKLQAVEIGKDVEKVEEKLAIQFTKNIAESAVAYSLEEYGNLNAWSVYNGLTHASQREDHASERYLIDRKAGQWANKILQAA